MKRTEKKMMKSVAVFATVVCATVGAFGLVACKDSVATPTNLLFEERTLTWDGVKGASQYVVEVNGKEFETKKNSFVLEDYTYGLVEMRVKAVAKNTQSAYSSVLEGVAIWELEVPQNIAQDGSLITWDEVRLATGYIVNVDGVQYEVSENNYEYTEQDSALIKVLASGNAEGTLLDSKYSEEFRLTATLATPKTSIRSTMLTWNTVENASAYEIFVNGQKVAETEETQYDFDWLYTGSISVSIKAVSNSENYKDSALSTAKTIILQKRTLSTPTNMRYENGVLSWDAVKGATAYTIWNNGAEYEVVNTNTYQIPQELLAENISRLQIRAESEIHFSSELSESMDVGMYSENNPVSVSSVTEFLAMSETGHYKLTEDLDLSLYTIEKQISVFKGSLDGNGHKITNLSVSLFDVLDGAKLKNLTVENATISLAFTESGARFGVLSNTAIGAKIENCEVVATLSVASQNGVGYVGGIFGVSEYSSMNKVSFVGSLTTEYCVTGGLVGKAQNPENTSEYTHCYVDATITLTGGETTPCGGFIGQFTDNALTVKECKAEVEIYTNAAYCGGFVGYMGTGQIVDCYAIGTLTNTNESMARVGGFIGRMEGYNNTVLRCISMMSISAKNDENIYVGGFVGNTVGGSYASVYKNCFYDSTLAPIDRIGNTDYGKGDGINAKTTEALKELSYKDGYSQEVWVLGNGELPSLVALSK